MKSSAPMRTAAAVLLLLHSCCCAVLYDQTGSMSRRGFTSNWFSERAVTAQMADDFEVEDGQRWTVDSVRVVGFYNVSTDVEYIHGFTVQIWSSKLNETSGISEPDSMLLNQQIVPAEGFNTTSTTFNLDPSITLFPAKYWLSIFAHSNSTSTTYAQRWYWRLRNTTEAGNIRGQQWMFYDHNGVFRTPEKTWLPASEFSSVLQEYDTVFSVSGTFAPFSTTGAVTTASPTTATGTTTAAAATTAAGGSTTARAATTASTVTATTTASVTASTSDGASSDGVKSEDDGGSGTMIGIAVGASIGGLLLIIAVILLVVLLRRRTRNTYVDRSNNPSTSVPLTPMPPAPITTNYANANVISGGPPGQSTSPAPRFLAPLGGKKESYDIDYSELTLDRQIGKGAFGVVYKGFWRGGAVAIKQLLSNEISQKELVDFQTEASLMSTLRPHVNVVQFLGITSSPTLCIITEFMEGGSLYNLLHSDAKIDINMMMTYVKGIAAGMLHLHSENIIHRDLASRNVLVSRDTVKISDFGMSRTFKDEGNQTKTETGPLKWMSPEAIMKREYSGASDVWSFGVTVWEIVTRSNPYPEYDAVQAAVEVTRGKPPLRLQPPEYCAAILAEIMLQCFETQPQNRPDFKAIFNRLSTSTMNEWTAQGGGGGAPLTGPRGAPPVSPRPSPRGGGSNEGSTPYDKMTLGHHNNPSSSRGAPARANTANTHYGGVANNNNSPGADYGHMGSSSGTGGGSYDSITNYSSISSPPNPNNFIKVKTANASSNNNSTSNSPALPRRPPEPPGQGSASSGRLPPRPPVPSRNSSFV